MESKILLFILVFLTIASCNTSEEPKTMSDENWRLGWRMIENSWEDKMDLAETQFDSLLTSGETIDARILISGLQIKSKGPNADDVLNIIVNQPKSSLKKICTYEFAEEYELCKTMPKNKVENEELQFEILELFVNDQAIRGNIMNDIIRKYNIDSTKVIRKGDIVIDDKDRERMKEIFWDLSFSDEELEIIYTYIDNAPEGSNIAKDIVSKHGFDPSSFTSLSMVFVDERNRKRLNEIIREHNFPTTKLIGRDAMRGVFLIIQHADGDREWQKSQLVNLKQAVDAGDLPKQNYAYLYDRIKVNEGQAQRYGSQFENVNSEKGIAQLRPTEDLDNLNQRRKAMEMMPIETYKRLILRN